MTEQELKLLELYQKTEPEPWSFQQDPTETRLKGIILEYIDESGDFSASWVAREVSKTNAQFITAAHETVPLMLARLEALEKELEEAKTWMARFSNDSEAYKQGHADGWKEGQDELKDQMIKGW